MKCRFEAWSAVKMTFFPCRPMGETPMPRKLGRERSAFPLPSLSHHYLLFLNIFGRNQGMRTEPVTFPWVRIFPLRVPFGLYVAIHETLQYLHKVRTTQKTLVKAIPRCLFLGQDKNQADSLPLRPAAPKGSDGGGGGWEDECGRMKQDQKNLHADMAALRSGNLHRIICSLSLVCRTSALFFVCFVYFVVCSFPFREFHLFRG